MTRKKKMCLDEIYGVTLQVPSLQVIILIGKYLLY